MSQHDLSIANQGFPAFRSDLNDALQALGTNNSGATAPSTTYANQLWYDTANNILKIRNEDNDAWITLITLDQSTDVVSSITATTVNGTTVAAGTLTSSGNTTLGDASGDSLTINASTVSTPNGLNFDSDTLVIDATNNRIGLGTSSPAYKLHLYSSSAVDVETGVTNSAGYSRFGTRSSGNAFAGSFTAGTGFEFWSAGSERMRIDSSGNVGIGTSSPSYRVDAQVSSNVRTARFKNTSNTVQDYTLFAANDSDVVIGLGVYGSAAGTTGMIGASSPFLSTAATELNILANNASGVIKFATGGNTERMRIDSAGTLMVRSAGGTAPWDATSGTFAWVGQSTYPLGLTAEGNLCAIMNRNTDVGAICEFKYNGVFKGNITTNGSTIAYNTSSDYRLKENIAPMTGALAKIQQLKPCTYTWKADGSNGEGFIAHELQSVIPDAVTGEKDAVDAEGNPVYQGIDTSFLVATLTAAIQELKAEVDSLKAQLNA